MLTWAINKSYIHTIHARRKILNVYVWENLILNENKRIIQNRMGMEINMIWK